MPSSADITVKLTLRPSVMEALKRLARADGLSVAEYIGDRLTDDLIAKAALPDDEAATLLAERELVSLARGIIDQVKRQDDWSEHVTLSIFEKIRSEAVGLYGRAVGAQYQGHVNRRIGSLVRRRLGAHVRTVRGKPIMANVSRRVPALIRTYTLLYREPQEAAE